MNGIWLKMLEDQERMRPVPIDLSVNLMVPEERLFILSLDELRKLEQQMFEVDQREHIALNQRGAAYELRFQEQRVVVNNLLRFAQSHPKYSPLADGFRIHEWLKANGKVITVFTLREALAAIRGLDEIVLAEPPVITDQPADQSVMAGEAAIFVVSASGSTPMTYQWRRDGVAILGGTSARYCTPATEFNSNSEYSVVISNAAGTVESERARLRTIYKAVGQ